MRTKENKRRTIIADLGLPKTTTEEGYKRYMREYMRRLRQQVRSPSKVLLEKKNPCLLKRRRK